VTLGQASVRVGVTPATLRRWIGSGLVPQYDGEWTPAAIGQAMARIADAEVFVARPRAGA
jgi:hypothetical protein